MIEIVNCEQGTPEWFAARLGLPTASRFKDILAKGEGKTRRAYMMDLLGERVTGEPAESYTNAAMERGKAMEADARAFYEFTQDSDVEQVGFIRNDVCGCSPDGLIGAIGILEIKTRLPRLQLELLLNPQLPQEHKAQVQGALWITGRAWCDFITYWPKLKPVIIRVERDEEYIDTLSKEVSLFLFDMDGLMKQYEAL